MAFKPLMAREDRWRRVNAPHLGALVKAGVEFPNGQAKMLEPQPALAGILAPAPRISALEEPIRST